MTPEEYQEADAAIFAGDGLIEEVPERIAEIPRRMKVQCSGALLECNGCLHARPHEPNSECENDCQDPDAKGGHCCPVDTQNTEETTDNADRGEPVTDKERIAELEKENQRLKNSDKAVLDTIAKIDREHAERVAELEEEIDKMMPAYEAIEHVKDQRNQARAELVDLREQIKMIEKAHDALCDSTKISVEFDERRDHDIQLISMLNCVMSYAESHFDEEYIKNAVVWFGLLYCEVPNELG